MADKIFRVAMSERCFRFKPDALAPHAPRRPGVYEFVTFNEKLEPRVLYVGLALPGDEKGATIYDALAQHMMGGRRPGSDELFKAASDVYFDYVMPAPELGLDDLKDIAGALALRHKPSLQPSTPPPGSGRYTKVVVEEIG